jgi:hypothetical protein
MPIRMPGHKEIRVPQRVRSSGTRILDASPGSHDAVLAGDRERDPGARSDSISELLTKIPNAEANVTAYSTGSPRGVEDSARDVVRAVRRAVLAGQVDPVGLV